MCIVNGVMFHVKHYTAINESVVHMNIIDIVQYNDTSYYCVFRIGNDTYRIWYYTNVNKKVLQKLVDNGADTDIIEICVFE